MPSSSNWPFSWGLLTRFLYTSLISRLRATCPARLIPLVVITRTIFGYGYTKFLFMQSPPVLILVYNLKWPLPSTSLPVHYSPFILSFDPILSELASAPCMLRSSPTSIIHLYALSNAHKDGPYYLSVLSVIWSWKHVDKFWQNVLPSLCHLRPSQIYVWVWIDCSLSADIQ